MPKSTRAIKLTDKNKSWNRKKTYKNPYTSSSTPKSKAFLIVCEGQNTEPQYFNSIPVVTADVKTIGLGSSKIQLVEYAVELSKREEYKGREVWCVFDLDFKGEDATLKEDYNFAIEYATKEGLHVAYSNDSFELWIILHFKFIQAAFIRQHYYQMLSEIWGINYEKEGKRLSFCVSLYDKLQEHAEASEKEAIDRATRLLEEHEKKPYADQNPCTTVFRLVEELNKYLKK